MNIINKGPTGRTTNLVRGSYDWPFVNLPTSAESSVISQPNFPTNLGDDQVFTGLNVFRYQEWTNKVLQERLTLSASGIGDFIGLDTQFPEMQNLKPGSTYPTPGANVSAGTIIDSYYIHFDPSEPTDSRQRLTYTTGTITFPKRIIGFIADTIQMNTSNATNQLGRPGYTYGDSGLEIRESEDGWGAFDSVRLLSDGRTLRYAFRARGLDAFRVITEPTNAAPSFAGLSFFTTDENNIDVGQVLAVDPDNGPSPLNYSVDTSNLDGRLFRISPSGTLSFVSVPDFENPLDQGLDNDYDLNISVSDGLAVVTNRFRVRVTNVNEPPTLTRSLSSIEANVLTSFGNSGTWGDPESGNVVLTASLGDIVKNANGNWDWSYTPTEKLVNQVVTISASDGTNVSKVTFNVTAYTTIATRGIQYDGATGVSASTSLATDKVPLLPGQTSTFANYTNYSRGLNGLVIDVVGLPASVTDAQLAASLLFANWDGIDAAGFVALPGAAVPTVSIIAGGVAGSTRVRILFPDNTLQNTWLRVTVAANADTGLAANDVFYFGNVIGDLNIGNTATRLRVNGQDTGLILSNQSAGINSAGVTNIFDLNRDGRVNGLDTGILLANQQAGGIVAPITAPSARPAARGSFDSSGVGAGGIIAPLPSLGASTKDTIDRRENQNLAVGVSNGLLDKTLVSRGGEAPTNVAVIDLSAPSTNLDKETEKRTEPILTGLDLVFASFWGRI